MYSCFIRAWDTATAVAVRSALGTLGLLLAVIVLALFIASRVYKVTVKREREFLRDVMAPEQARDVITSAELDAMVGNRKARRRYRRAAGRTRRERRRARYVLHAAYYLARELAASRGAEDGRVRFARSEVERIRAGRASIW